jgi:3-hydroxyacyl-[acyl-carrier-protein] dehydratase
MAKYLFLNNLFTVTNSEVSENACNTTITLNPEHDIYKGHFPDNPITPGVCILQMVKETMMHSFKVSLQLEKLIHSKFLAFIHPVKQNKVDFDIKIKSKDEWGWHIAAVVKSESGVHAKFSGHYKFN